MLFKVDCHNGCYYYNNLDNTIMTEDGLVLDFKIPSNFVTSNIGYVGSSNSYYTEQNLLMDFSIVRHLIIFLGTRCNYNCTYCFQNQSDYI